MTEKTERELIESARNSLRNAENEWREAIAALLGVVRLNKDPALANAAFGVAADLTDELGSMMRTHKRATDVLLESWPQYGDVVTRGPGR